MSVIVVAYNSALVLTHCLDALSEHLPDAEIVVVDNGSRDDSVALAESRPSVLLVTGHGNVGFGAGVNLGARAASRRFLMVLNPDAWVVEVDHSRLESVSSESITGVIGCRVQGTDLRYRSLQFDSWNWRGELYWAMCEHFLVPREIILQRPRIAGRRGRHWIAGAAFLVARGEFLDVGGFDPAFFLYYEDCDLSRAYLSRGLPIRTTSAITVAHAGGGSSPRDSSTMTGYCLLGLIEYVAKWEGRVAALHAAAHGLRLLHAIEGIGGSLAHAPLIGTRARQKQASARTVRSWLVAAANQTPVPGAYPAAMQALREALSASQA